MKDVWERWQLWNVPPTLAELHPAGARRGYCISEEGKTKDQRLLDEVSSCPNTNEKQSQDQLVQSLVQVSIIATSCFLLKFPACVIGLSVLAFHRCLVVSLHLYISCLPLLSVLVCLAFDCMCSGVFQTVFDLNSVFDLCACWWFGTAARLVYRYGWKKQTDFELTWILTLRLVRTTWAVRPLLAQLNLLTLP